MPCRQCGCSFLCVFEKCLDFHATRKYLFQWQMFLILKKYVCNFFFFFWDKRLNFSFEIE